MGRKTIIKDILKGTCGRPVHGCKIIVFNLINKDTTLFFQEQETNLL
jgi:hypothetical protein